MQPWGEADSETRWKTRCAARRALVWGVVLALLGAPVVAFAIDPSLCADDGETEVPPFASGRDANQCLMIDPGNGDPPVPFQYETFHQKGVSSGCTDVPRTAPTVSLGIPDHCSTRDAGEYCSRIVWDTVVDNYLDPACKNEDGIFFSKGTPLEYYYFKNARILNSWKCLGGGGWSGPNGIGCAPGETSAAHVDGIQLRGNPVNGGWWIMQDSEFLNGYNYHFLHQAQSDWGGNGSVMFQGVHFGRAPVAGAATSYSEDCIARGATNRGICEVGKTLIDYDAKEYWLVDVFGTAHFKLKGQHEKIVVVNTGCDTRGCSGSIGYSNGWPHPLTSGQATGPGTCPNGSIGSCVDAEGSVAKDCYCYTSIEAVIADTSCADCPHELPPFIQLSTAGWLNPPP